MCLGYASVHYSIVSHSVDTIELNVMKILCLYGRHKLRLFVNKRVSTYTSSSSLLDIFGSDKGNKLCIYIENNTTIATLSMCVVRRCCQHKCCCSLYYYNQSACKSYDTKEDLSIVRISSIFIILLRRIDHSNAARNNNYEAKIIRYTKLI